MTTIAMVEHPDKVEIAWDSFITYHTVEELNQESHSKVFENSTVVFGVCGLLRVLQVFEFMSIPKRKKNTDGRTYLAKKLVPAMKSALKEAYDHEKSIDSTWEALVIVDGSVYNVASDFSWLRMESDFYAIGSGQRIARGYYEGTKDLKGSLEAAAKWDPHTGGTIHYLEAEKAVA